MNHQVLLALGALLLGASNAFVFPASKVPSAVGSSLQSYYGRQWSEPYETRNGGFSLQVDDFDNRRANDYWNRQFRNTQRYGTDGRSWNERYGSNQNNRYWSNGYNSMGTRGRHGPWQDRYEYDGRYADYGGRSYQTPYARDRVGNNNMIGSNNRYWNDRARDPYARERINPNDSYSRRGNNYWNGRSLSSRDPYSRDRNYVNGNNSWRNGYNGSDVNRRQNSFARGSAIERVQNQRNSWNNGYNSYGSRGGYGSWQDRAQRDPYSRVNPTGRYGDYGGRYQNRFSMYVDDGRYQSPYAHERVRVNGHDNINTVNSVY